jgi:heme/copper-type cytochrome/quinol oxidase subunit 3
VATSEAIKETKAGAKRIALFVTLGTETVFFLTALVAYVALRGQVEWNVSHSFNQLAIPLANTAILLISAGTAWWAANTARKGQPGEIQKPLVVTLLLGLVFIAGQVYEFNRAGLSIDDQALGGVFFTLITFHAVHVFAGMVFNGLNLMRTYQVDFSSTESGVIVLGSWFWYYVTAVWLVLFTALYML